MKLFTLLFCFILLSCSQTKESIGNFETIKFKDQSAEQAMHKLFSIWKQKDPSLIKKEFGKPDKEQLARQSVTYSYKTKFESSYYQLTITEENNLVTKIYYDLLDDRNKKINAEWIQQKFHEDKWSLRALPEKNPHVVLKKRVLINKGKKIMAGFLEDQKNNQLHFIYFGDIDEKNLDLFFWE